MYIDSSVLFHNETINNPALEDSYPPWVEAVVGRGQGEQSPKADPRGYREKGTPVRSTLFSHFTYNVHEVVLETLLNF